MSKTNINTNGEVDLVSRKYVKHSFASVQFCTRHSDHWCPASGVRKMSTDTRNRDFKLIKTLFPLISFKSLDDLPSRRFFFLVSLLSFPIFTLIFCFLVSEYHTVESEFFQNPPDCDWCLRETEPEKKIEFAEDKCKMPRFWRYLAGYYYYYSNDVSFFIFCQ